MTMSLQAANSGAQAAWLHLDLLANAESALLQGSRNDRAEASHAKDAVNRQAGSPEVATDGSGVHGVIERGQ
jgi:hypothetical protein